MKKLKPYFLLILCAALMSACRVGDTNIYVTTGMGDFHALTIGTLKCPQNEAATYISSFSDYYGTIGDIEIHRDEEGDFSGGWIKKSAILLLSRVYSLNLYANDNKIALSDEELMSAKSAAAEFMKQVLPQDAAKININEADIQAMYERYALALKVYKMITVRADSEISEDEARVMDAYVLYLGDVSKASEVEQRIANGDDFASLVQVYSDGDKRLLSIRRGELPQKVEEAAFFLNNNQISSRIDADNGCYYVKCIEKQNEEQSQENRNRILEQRQKTLINEIINEQSEKYYSSINEEFFDAINVEDIRVPASRGFFSTIEKNL